MGTLKEGAENAVRVCMAVSSGEHVLILTDQATLEVGQALAKSAEGVTP